MNNIVNIFNDRRSREREKRLTYSKYIFNSHLIMFLIIVLGAIMINYSRWLEKASLFEMNVVFISASTIFSYFLVSLRVKTYVKEADSVFLLPLEKYYGKVVTRTAISLSVSQLILLIAFYVVVKPLLNNMAILSNYSIASSVSISSLLTLIITVIINVVFRLSEVVYYKERFLTKALLFTGVFIQILETFVSYDYIQYVNLVIVIALFVLILITYKNSNNVVLKWNEAAEYDKHREENYLKFVSMFVDVPLNGIKVARRKYFDILLPKLTDKNFTVENSFKYYYYRVFLRQENTVFLALRLLLISSIIIYSFNNAYVNLVVIVSYSYLTIIQLIPLHKQIRNNIWHSILPVSDEVKVNSFKKLLVIVILSTTFILTLISFIIGGFSYMVLGMGIIGFVVANLLARLFISKVK